MKTGPARSAWSGDDSYADLVGLGQIVNDLFARKGGGHALGFSGPALMRRYRDGHRLRIVGILAFIEQTLQRVLRFIRRAKLLLTQVADEFFKPRTLHHPPTFIEPEATLSRYANG